MTHAQRRFLAGLKALGFEVLSVRQNKHLVVRIRAPDGREVSLTVAVSPSCRRAERNAAGITRRIAKGPNREGTEP